MLLWALKGPNSEETMRHFPFFFFPPENTMTNLSPTVLTSSSSKIPFLGVQAKEQLTTAPEAAAFF